jgi:hypothetical protein
MLVCGLEGCLTSGGNGRAVRDGGSSESPKVASLEELKSFWGIRGVSNDFFLERLLSPEGIFDLFGDGKAIGSRTNPGLALRGLSVEEPGIEIDEALPLVFELGEIGREREIALSLVKFERAVEGREVSISSFRSGGFAKSPS